ncbi:MAG: histone deacetylase family protein [Thermoleophilaceae bacterium]
MRLWAHDRFLFPLPSHHRFPLGKYGLLRERVVELGLASAEEIIEPAALDWEDLALVHSPALVERVRHGSFTKREEQALGLPWSPELAERARRATRSTVEAAFDALEEGVGMNLGGGTHHAGHDVSRGYCLINDVAVAAACARREEWAERVLVVDCDVHQGDGTAELFAEDPDTFTLSLHCALNYPFTRACSDLDVDLPSSTGDEAYLSFLSSALDQAFATGPFDLAFYLAGAHPWEGDALGRLSLTKEGLRARDDLVLERLRAEGAPACVVLAGGYAPNIEDTVEINAGTVAAVTERARAAPRVKGKLDTRRSTGSVVAR